MLWMLIWAVLCSLHMEVSGQCWESPECQDLSTEENMLGCNQLCKAELEAEGPVYPGKEQEQPQVSENNEIDTEAGPAPLETPQALPKAREADPAKEPRRIYPMGPFRWGKPVVRKRVRVQNNVPGEMRRSASPNDVDYSLAPEELEESALASLLQQKKDGSYKMNHFRWGAPPASKRYGGFVKSWDERSQKPYLALLKNAINKDGQQKNGE